MPDIINTEHCRLVHGDMETELAAMEPESVDCVVCDPPYGLNQHPLKDVLVCLAAWLAGQPFRPTGGGFMGKAWDSWVPGPEAWRAAYRVLKPGGYLIAFAGSRTDDLMGLAIRLAGFEIRDGIAWLHGQGFPKNHNVALAIDEHLGVESLVAAVEPQQGAKFQAVADDIDNGGFNDPDRAEFERKAPASPEGQAWDGWGTALSPAFEPIVLARKPFEGTVAAQVLATGTGGLNIDACLTGARNQTIVRGGNTERGAYGSFAHDTAAAPTTFTYTKGRWPKNVLLEHLPGCEAKGTRRVRSTTPGAPQTESNWGEGGPKRGVGTKPGHGAEDGFETVTAWACTEGCPVADLDRQSGSSSSSRTRNNSARSGAYGVYGDRAPVPTGGHEDAGGASRYFPTFHPFVYQPKPSRAEKEAGLAGLAGHGVGALRDGGRGGDGVRQHTGGEATGRKDGSAGLNSPRAGAGRTGGARNIHPTVKSVPLMAWLVRLVCPPGGVVLDPFCGSGSTGVAALREGMRFIGIEAAAEYIPIAKGRLSQPVQTSLLWGLEDSGV